MSFFYATESAHNYDEHVGLTSEHYELAHSIMKKLILHDLKNSRKNQLIDLGCGTGAVFFNLVEEIDYLRFKAFDISAEMIQEFKTKLEKRTLITSNEKTVSFLKGDVRDSIALKAVLSRPDNTDRLTVTSAFMLHHFEASEKEMIYSLIAEALRPGERFLLLDLFDYHDPVFSEFALDVEIDWIEKSFNKLANDNPKNKQEIDLENRKWKQHLRAENKPLSIGWNDKGDRVSEELLLKKAGFSTINCCFKYFQTAILVIQK